MPEQFRPEPLSLLSENVCNNIQATMKNFAAVTADNVFRICELEGQLSLAIEIFNPEQSAFFNAKKREWMIKFAAKKFGTQAAESAINQRHPKLHVQAPIYPIAEAVPVNEEIKPEETPEVKSEELKVNSEE